MDWRHRSTLPESWIRWNTPMIRYLPLAALVLLGLGSARSAEPTLAPLAAIVDGRVDDVDPGEEGPLDGRYQILLWRMFGEEVHSPGAHGSNFLSEYASAPPEYGWRG